MRMWRNSARSPTIFSSAWASRLLYEPLRTLPTNTAILGLMVSSLCCWRTAAGEKKDRRHAPAGSCRAPTSSRFDELQRHPIRFADRLHLRVLRIRPGQVRRQTMHVDVFRVLRIGIDFRSARQAEPGTQSRFDHVILGDAMQLSRAFLRSGERFGAMIGDAKYATGLEHLERRLEYRIQSRGTLVQPIVRVAESQHHVGRIVGPQFHLIRRGKRHDLRDAAVHLRIGLQFLLEFARSVTARWWSGID